MDERDLLTINYTSGTTARPKGVMITHRNATMNSIGTLLHLPIAGGRAVPVDAADVPRERLDLYLDGDRRRGDARLPAQGRAGRGVPADPRGERVASLCAAPTVLISLANAPAEVRGEVPPGVHVVTAGAPPAAATIERLEGEFGWEVTQVYGLTETAPFITVCAPLPEHEKLTPGRPGGAEGADRGRAAHLG